LIAGTHIAFSTVLYLGGAALFEYQPSLIGWGLAAVASLLPDIDLPTSKLGRVFFFISTRLEREYGHRTVTHSLLAVAAVAVLASPLLYLDKASWFWAVVGGYWSHIWIDMVNLRGVDLLWPSPTRDVFPGNPRYRMETGSKAEMVLFVCLIGFSALLYPVSGIGIRAGLQHMLGNFEMAYETYQKGAGKHWYTLKLEGRYNLSLKQVKAECQVVGTWKKGLIVIEDGELRAVGESEIAHNIYPVHAELIEGEPLQVISHRVDMRGRTLRWLLDRIDTKRTYYISGEIRVGARLDNPVEDLQMYHPASFTGQVLRLHYARAEDLGRYVGLLGAEGEVFVQFWLKEGDPPLEIDIEEQEDVETVPEELRKYL